MGECSRRPLFLSLMLRHWSAFFFFFNVSSGLFGSGVAGNVFLSGKLYEQFVIPLLCVRLRTLLRCRWCSSLSREQLLRLNCAVAFLNLDEPQYFQMRLYVFQLRNRFLTSQQPALPIRFKNQPGSLQPPYAFLPRVLGRFLFCSCARNRNRNRFESMRLLTPRS